MLSNNVIVRRSPLLDLFLPQRPLQRLALCFFILCLIGSAAGITVIIHEQSNQVLLVGTAAAQQPAATSVSIPSTASTTTTLQQTGNASKTLIRINQSDMDQYASQQQHDDWWPSTCSTTSMTEVMDAYGAKLKIKDVLAVEAQIGAITASSGLQYDNGINDTAERFGFEVTTPAHPSISQLIETANAGTPIIINFAPHAWSPNAPDWTPGHFLVVIGGTSSTVRLADSSIVNHGAGLQEVSYAYFQTYWHGYERILKPSKYVITHGPTLSANQINRILAYQHSPAAGIGQDIYNMSVKYGIDDVYVLVTFGHESGFGTEGEAETTRSPGNLRCIANANCVNTAGLPCQAGQSCYAQFATWQQGFDALYRLLKGPLYAGDGRIIPETIIPRFAPQSDNNDEAAYITALKRGIDAFRAGSLTLPQ